MSLVPDTNILFAIYPCNFMTKKWLIAMTQRFLCGLFRSYYFKLSKQLKLQKSITLIHLENRELKKCFWLLQFCLFKNFKVMELKSQKLFATEGPPNDLL